MIRVANVAFRPKAVPKDLKSYVAELTGFDDIIFFRISKKSVDARKKENLHLLYAFDIGLAGDESEAIKNSKYKDVVLLEPQAPYVSPVWRNKEPRPIVIGTGPAGLFAALALAESGANPIVLERGKPLSERRKDVRRFWRAGELDEDSNVQFGEGGAGTFSDGKLNTGIKKDSWTRKVLEEFVSGGAPEEIMYLAKPHIGTDKLFNLVRELRCKILSLGGEYHFNTKVTDLIIKDGRLTAVQVLNREGKEEILTASRVIMAIGHSARDTFEMMHRRGVAIEQKPFAVGARIEHTQAFINKSQYGITQTKPILGPADYKLAVHLENGRSAYTFCMCPGGLVVAAASEAGCLVTNGMSEYARDAENANGALLVDVQASDFGSGHPLAGMEFQRRIEELAFKAGGSSYKAPAQRVTDFLKDRETKSFTEVQPSYLPGAEPADMRAVLPDFVVETLKLSFKKLDRKIAGFSEHGAVLTAAETRSSSPIRILRDKETMQSVNVEGLYPCGEGAGYAGGIMSAAVDGLKSAHRIIETAI